MLPCELTELVLEKWLIDKWRGTPLYKIPHKDYKTIQKLNLYKHFDFNPFFVEKACLNGDTHFIKWLYKSENQAFNSELVVWSANCGRIELTEWLLEKMMKPDLFNIALAAAAKYGHIPLLERLFPKTMDQVPAIQSACENGHAHVIEWFAERVPRDTFLKSDALMVSASNGHLYSVKWLHTQFPEMCNHSVFDWAAGNGHQKVVEWLHWHCQHEPCTIVSILVATRRGNLKMVQWLYENRPEVINSLDIVQTVADVFQQDEISEWITDLRTLSNE